MLPLNWSLILGSVDFTQGILSSYSSLIVPLILELKVIYIDLIIAGSPRILTLPPFCPYQWSLPPTIDFYYWNLHELDIVAITLLNDTR